MKLSFTIENFSFKKDEIQNLVFRLRKKKQTKTLLKGEKFPFIENINSEISNKFFENGSGIDFYIDCGRYFPN